MCPCIILPTTTTDTNISDSKERRLNLRTVQIMFLWLLAKAKMHKIVILALYTCLITVSFLIYCYRLYFLSQSLTLQKQISNHRLKFILIIALRLSSQLFVRWGTIYLVDVHQTIETLAPETEPYVQNMKKEKERNELQTCCSQ